jgi:hypothetical protein
MRLLSPQTGVNSRYAVVPVLKAMRILHLVCRGAAVVDAKRSLSDIRIAKDDRISVPTLFPGDADGRARCEL